MFVLKPQKYMYKIDWVLSTNAPTNFNISTSNNQVSNKYIR